MVVIWCIFLQILERQLERERQAIKERFTKYVSYWIAIWLHSYFIKKVETNTCYIITHWIATFYILESHYTKFISPGKQNCWAIGKGLLPKIDSQKSDPGQPCCRFSQRKIPWCSISPSEIVQEHPYQDGLISECRIITRCSTEVS